MKNLTHEEKQWVIESYGVQKTSDILPSEWEDEEYSLKSLGRNEFYKFCKEMKRIRLENSANCKK